ncbi:MAG: flagellar biosynthesis protein FlhF [Sideroxyarcus sp.]|nr:flagellar biosynthesis protein FlhF [Sideroxyarcus sp.]
MNARKFIAASSRAALQLVRAELGAEAVILSNRKVAGGVEIVAMAGSELAHLNETRMVAHHTEQTHSAPRERVSARALNQAAALGAKVIAAQAGRAAPTPTETPQANNEAQQLMHELKSMHDKMQAQMAGMAWSTLQQQDPQRSGLLRDLVNVGFSPALSRLLLDKMPPAADISWVKRILAHNLCVVTKREDVVARGGVYALVGPTGVGKTTTTAKLAARAVVRYGADKVALVTTDSYRVGAFEQLRIYAKILGVSVHAVRDAHDLQLTLSGLKHKHLVLIDTMGVSQRDSRVAEQTRMFDAAGVKRLLLLNATAAGGTLDDVVKMYGGAGVIGCIPTKLDEAVQLGTVLDVVARHKLMLHYIASGQRVPEDLHEVNVDYLLHRAFKEIGKPSAFALQDMEFPAFMAGLAKGTVARGEYAL